MAIMRAMRNQETMKPPMSASLWTLDVCQPAGACASLEQMGFVLRFPKLSLQGDRMGVQSAFKIRASAGPNAVRVP